MRARCIKADCINLDETGERIRVWEPRGHERGDVRWTIFRSDEGLFVDDYCSLPSGPVTTMDDAFRIVEKIIEADTEALIRAIPRLEPMAF